MDRRINKTKVKLTQIPEVYSKSYKNILKRVVYARSLQEIGDVETLNQTQLGKLKEQGFKFQILNEEIEISKFKEYLEAVNKKDKFIKLNELYLDLQKAKYKPLIDDDEKSFSVTNKRNFNITFKEKNNKLYAIVQGYKTDIDLGEVSNKLEDAKTLINSINIKWMKENDPNFESYLEQVKSPKENTGKQYE